MKLYEPGQLTQAVTVLGAFGAVLALTFAGSAAYHHLRDVAAQRELAAARESMTHLNVPANYQQFSTGCSWYRCYVIDQPTTDVSSTLRPVFVSTGATPMTPARPLKNFPQLNMFGCNTTTNSEGKVATCTLTGWVHGQPVIVFLHPYFGGVAHRDWYLTRSEVDISFKPNSPGGR